MAAEAGEKRGSRRDSVWHVAVLAAVMAFFESSSFRSSGYFYGELMNEFNIDRGTASWPVFVLGTVSDMGGVFAGPLARRYSISSVMTFGAVLISGGMIASAFAPDIFWITITMGLVHGLGAGSLVTLLQVILSMNFEKYRGTAHGIMYIGSTFSALVTPQLLVFLRKSYNFRISLLLFGAILLHTIPISFSFRIFSCAHTAQCTENITRESDVPVETRNDTDENAREEIPLVQVMQVVLRLPMFYVVTLTWLIMFYNLDIFTPTIVDYALDKGVSNSDALLLISYTSFADLLGRVLLPLLADRNILRRSTLTACNLCMLGAAVTCLPPVTSYPALVGVTLAVSVFMGCGVSMCGVLLADYVGLENLEVAYCLMGLLCSPLLFVKPFFVGFFRDRLGTYDNIYQIFAGLLFFLSLLWCLTVFSERRLSKRYVFGETTSLLMTK